MRRPTLLPPPWRTGYYYTLPGVAVTGAAPGDGHLRVFPLDIHRPVLIDRLASEVTVLAAASALRWVVYADDGRSFPGALVLDTGAVGDSTTTGAKEATVSLRLAARRYWFGCVAQGGSPTLRSFSGASAFGAGLTSTVITSGFTLGFRKTGITGAAPTPFPTDGAPSSQVPSVWLRVA